MANVFTNGCFDLLHEGHKHLLKECSKLGVVYVGINSDASVKRLKGPSRPMWNQYKRKEELLKLSYINSVHIFEEDTPYELIKLLKPDVLVKGFDYLDKKVVGENLVGELVFIPLLEGFSTTSLIGL